ncbi:hypothetical protein [Caproiciproducens sp.]
MSNFKISKEQLVKDIAAHKTGYLINVGDSENPNNAFELFSMYFGKCQKLHNWLSFSNCNPQTDENRKITMPIEDVGEFSLNLDKVGEIYSLNEEEKQDLFEFEVPTVYQIKTFPDADDLYIGLMN